MLRLFITYTKKNQKTEEVYSGMTSGEYTNSPEDADKNFRSERNMDSLCTDCKNYQGCCTDCCNLSSLAN